MTDPFNLERFVTAQEPVFDTVLNELRAGEATGCGSSFLSCAASGVPQWPNITASALSLRRAPTWPTRSLGRGLISARGRYSRSKRHRLMRFSARLMI
jgi:uncharacterized protein (DUF1810 family)